jgi:hypothetical protein
LISLDFPKCAESGARNWNRGNLELLHVPVTVCELLNIYSHAVA